MERALPHLVLINHWPPVAAPVRANVILVVLITKLPKLKEEALVRLQVVDCGQGL